MGKDEQRSSDDAQPLSLPSKQEVMDAVDSTKTVEDRERPREVLPSLASDKPGFTNIPIHDPTDLESPIGRTPTPAPSTNRWPIAPIIALVVILVALIAAAFIRTAPS